MGKLTVRYAPRRGTAENKRNSGFTLVEMLLTTAILVILLGLSMVAVVRWRDPLKITELDNAAREIYMAAENRSVLLQGSGAAAARLSSSGVKLPSVDVDDGGKPVKVDAVMLSDDDIGDLLPAGNIEPKLWDGHFYVLYDEKTHHVFEVFYAEEEFSKDTLDALRDKSRSERIRLFRRVEGNNINCLVGYYGGGLVDRSELKRLPKPGVEVMIENGNELTLTVKYTMPADLPDGVTREPTVTLEYQGTPPVVLQSKSGTPNIIYSVDGGRLKHTGDIGIATAGSTVTYTWVLDSLVQDADGNFTQQLRGLGLTDLGYDFTATASLRLSADGYIESYNEAQDSNNSLFAEGSSDETAYIENLRHLQNLDSASSGAGGKTAAELLTDIDASKVKDNAGTELNNAYEFKPIDNPALRSYDGKEKTISNLKVTSSSADGKAGAGLFSVMYGEKSDKKFEIKDVLLDKPDISGHDYAGALAGYSNFVKLTNCKISGAGAKVKGNVRSGGMIGYWWGSAELSGCVVEDVEVTGTGTAGAIAGYGANATFTNCNAKQVKIESSNLVGGLVGEIAGDCSLENCHIVGGETKSTAHYAGGIVGFTAGSSTKFESCGAEGLTVTSKTYSVGGLVGFAQSDSVSFGKCEVENLKVETETGYAGGLVGSGGESSRVAFDNCTVGQKTGTDITITGTQAGGVLGNADGEATLNGCTVGNMKTTKKITVKGSDYAGGMVGNSGKPKNQLTDCKVFNTDVATSGDGSEAGGLVGRATEASFEDCSANSTDVTGIMNAGGLVGGAIGGSLNGCETDKVTVTADSFVGGLVGNASDGGALMNCKAVNTTVTAKKIAKGDASEAGGLVGRTKGTNLKDCQVYWSWNDKEEPLLTGTDDYKVTAVTAGGLVGAVRSGGMIESSFAATLVKGTTYAGGLVGSLPAEKTTVTITKSYADCYIEAGPGGETADGNKQIPYAGGLIGIKETSVQLKLENVYAAGFINMIEGGQAAGLCGGWVAEGNKNELTAQNAYAAIHYETPGAGYPLACTADYSGCMNNCYFLESNWGWLNMTHAAMSNIPMGDDFEKKEAVNPDVDKTKWSHPYNLDKGSRVTYDFPGLAGLPHYGDWPTS